jgi:hypothetical protein
MTFSVLRPRLSSSEVEEQALTSKPKSSGPIAWIMELLLSMLVMKGLRFVVERAPEPRVEIPRAMCVVVKLLITERETCELLSAATMWRDRVRDFARRAPSHRAPDRRYR